MRILGLVCARGGSKGLKNKNLSTLLGKPLLAYTIEAYKAWGKTDRIICSTDSEDIKKITLKYGAEVPFMRPAELATDTAAKIDVFKHALDFCEEEENQKYDFVIDFDITAPLRKIADVDLAFNKLINSDADLLISAYPAERNPYFNMVELDDNGYAHRSKIIDKNIVARQTAPKVYSLSSIFYMYRRNYLKKATSHWDGKVIIYEVPYMTLDIDTQSDFEIIEYLLKEGKFKFDF